MQWTSTNAHGDKEVKPISDDDLKRLRNECNCISDKPSVSGFDLACLIKRLDNAEHPTQAAAILAAKPFLS